MRSEKEGLVGGVGLAPISCEVIWDGILIWDKEKEFAEGKAIMFGVGEI